MESALCGSSPHTRGARSCRVRLGVQGGIIPAYAGSTSTQRLRPCSRRDHPRIRGEHLGYPRYDFGDGGIIPAYAGSTPSQAPRSRRGQDHPRIRGEHDFLVQPAAGCRGSSPHTRGARREELQETLVWRIIPAYAGSTADGAVAYVPERDHPRIRGEHGDPGSRTLYLEGSSPHTRGARA